MILKLRGSEGDLTSASNVGSAQLVRVYNSGGTALLLTQKAAGGATLGTVTIKGYECEFIKKASTDTLEGGAALKAVAVAFAH